PVPLMVDVTLVGCVDIDREGRVAAFLNREIVRSGDFEWHLLRIDAEAQVRRWDEGVSAGWRSPAQFEIITTAAFLEHGFEVIGLARIQMNNRADLFGASAAIAGRVDEIRLGGAAMKFRAAGQTAWIAIGGDAEQTGVVRMD